MNGRSTPWDENTDGVLILPSGRRVRGRGLRRQTPPGPEPELGVYLAGTRPDAHEWESRWVKWRDFWVPSSPSEAIVVLTEAWEAAAECRVEVACGGGVGRTGTALAVLATIDGLPGSKAIKYVRENYHPRAIETPWQRRFVELASSSVDRRGI